MAVSINGTTGISGVDGSASAPVVKGTDGNTGLSFGTDIIDLNTGGSSRFKVGAAGQLGVAGANYGTSGQALVSQGASAAPQWASVGGGGKILQVLQTVKSDTSSTNSQTEADLMTRTIQPTAASSKILLFVDIKMGGSSNSVDPIFLLYRDSQKVYHGDAAGNRITSMFGADEFDSTNNAQWLMKCVQAHYLDTPSYTLGDTLTYKVKWRIVDTGHTLYLNRTGADNNAANYGRTASSITAIEVGA